MADNEWDSKAIHDHWDKQDKPKEQFTCTWDRHFLHNRDGFGDGWIPRCDLNQYWFDHGKENMTYCPHCGKVIADGIDKRYSNE